MPCFPPNSSIPSKRPKDASTRSGGIFDLPKLESELKKLEEQSAEPDFWNDPSAANRILQKMARLKDRISPIIALEKSLRDVQEMYQLLELEADAEVEKETDSMAADFLRRLDEYELQTLLSGEYDDRNAIVEINAGAGGTEACDWALMLFRLYSRYAQRHGYKMEVLSETEGDVTGYRFVSFLLAGTNAYGYLKAEHGVHRLVRISPFDSNARRHTSFCRVEVLPEIEESEVEIDPTELKVETLRAGGAGGQHVNKTESAVRITHIPTGITVQCQNERSQHANRASAMLVLASRLNELRKAESDQKIREIKGEISPAEWGRQIRSYVMQPYTMVKDHRTGHETGNVLGVLDGDIDGFIEAYLRQKPAEDAFVE